MTPEQRAAHERLQELLKNRTSTHACHDTDDCDKRIGRRIHRGITPDLLRDARRLKSQGVPRKHMRETLRCGWDTINRILERIEAEDAAHS